MTNSDILRLRLFNQRLTGAKFKNIAEAVSYLGAVQSQDYPGAKWALGQRLSDTNDQVIEKAFNNGEILRTHVMRPTWHFVHPKDISWMLELTKDRVKTTMGSYNKFLGLNEEIFTKSKKIIEKELNNKNFLTRTDLGELLKKNRIKWLGNGLAHIVMMAELDGLICSGPLKGKQQTYALLGGRVTSPTKLNRNDSLQELAKRYFQSHGPATLKDFVWWSGLKTADARWGIEANKLEQEKINGITYYFSKSNPPEIPDKVYLLPNYDEFGIAYKDRDAFFDSKYKSFLDVRGNSIFQHLIIYKGIMIGTWRRTLKKSTVVVEAKYFEKPNSKVLGLFEVAAKDYTKFLRLELKIY